MVKNRRPEDAATLAGEAPAASDPPLAASPQSMLAPTVFDNLQSLALAALDAIAAISLARGGGSFRDLAGRETPDQFAILGRVYHTYLGERAACELAFGDLARVSQGPVSTVFLRALSTTEYALRLCVFFVDHVQRNLKIRLVREDALSAEDRKTLETSWPHLREVYCGKPLTAGSRSVATLAGYSPEGTRIFAADSNGLLPSLNKCAQMKAQVQWECARAKALLLKKPADGPWSKSGADQADVSSTPDSRQLAAATPASPDSRAPGALRPATVNGRMLALLEQDPEVLNWSARKWAERLGCAVSSVHGTAAWKRIQTARALNQAGRLEQQRSNDGGE
jgi:hypothetical protein